MTDQPTVPVPGVPESPVTPTTAPVVVDTPRHPDLPLAPRPDVESASEARLAYRLLTGPDDRAFCARVSAALADGYRLHGSPAVTFDGERVIVAQAVVLADHVSPDGALR